MRQRSSALTELTPARELTLADRWRVMVYARRGEAPTDPLMARAVVDWATAYLERGNRALERAFTAIGLVVFPCLTVFLALRGSYLAASATGLVVFVHLAQALLTPVFRVRNVRRALAAAEQYVEALDSPG
jgi:hypothetical protein